MTPPIVKRYVDNECSTQGLYAGIIAIEARIDAFYETARGGIDRYDIDEKDKRRLAIIMGIIQLSTDRPSGCVICKYLAYLRRCIYANEQATYLRTNCRDDYIEYAPTKREKRRR